MPLHYKVRNEYLQKRQYGSQTENIYNLVLYLKNVLISDVSPFMSFFFFFFFTSMLPISSLIEFYCLNTAEENHTSKQIARPKLHQEGGKVDARL